jgi:invasion protein IalB
MKMVRTAAHSLFGAATIIALSIAGAQAVGSKDAPAAAAPASVSAEPQNTSATYGDWVLHCTRNGDDPQAPRVCEVALPFQAQGQQGPFAELAIGHVNSKDPLRATVMMALNVSFPSTIRLSLDDKDTQPAELSWRFCVPTGCRADTELKDDTVKRWKAATGNGQMQFKDATGREITVPVSIRGLSQALDALAKS